MQKFKVRLLLPYDGLVDVVHSLANQFPRLDLVASVATLDDAVIQAIEAEKDQYDAIISRGDTMLMIREAVSLPVFNIEVSGMDFLRAITLAESYSRKWTFLGFPHIMQEARNLCAMLHNDASVNIIHSLSECETEIQRLHREGYTMIVGDARTVSWASKFGLHGVMIASSRESVYKTLESVNAFAEKIANYQETISLYKEVMSKSPRNTLVFDAQSNLIIHSGLNAVELAEHLRPYISSAFQTPFVQNILLRNNQVWKVETRQLNHPGSNDNPYVAFFCNRLNDAGLLLDFSKKEKIKVFEPINEQPLLLSSLPHNSPAMRDAVLSAQAHTTTGATLLFVGENGVETETFVHAVYQASSLAQNSLLQLDCSLLTVEDWMQLLSNAAQPLFRLLKGSSFALYLKNIDHLSADTQELLFNALTKSHQLNNLWILASAAELRNLTISGSSFQKLYYQLSPIVISIPPLRQRAEDIADLCSLAIGENNIRFGKSVAGIENNALDYLRSFNWPGNLPQFNNAMALLVKSAKGDYITFDDVQKLLHQHANSCGTANSPYINWHDSLDLMEASIIRYVYEQEDCNATKAAERLNISRSTLWRKLNQSASTEE